MKLGKSFISFLIDATSSFFIYQVVALILAYFYFLPFFPAFFVIWLLYYCFCFLSRGTTIGLAFVNAHLYDNGNPRTYIFRVILRESFTSFPAVVLWLFIWNSIAIVRIGLAAIVCLCLTICRNKLFKLQVRSLDNPHPCTRLFSSHSLSRSEIVWLYAILAILGTGSFGLNLYFTGDQIISSEKIIALRPRPSAHSVVRYTEFIKENSKGINEYVKELFQKYDHVVLCERWHPECTQYDMIYDLVSTTYFADSIGNVFTEIGNVNQRDEFRQLTATSFQSDSVREKKIASFIVNSQTVWLVWSNTNWFDFLKKMSVFNHNRKKPVNILFSDTLWTDVNKLSGRDSLMASNIIKTIKSDKIGKSLIIMNYRHAFFTPHNCAYYLQNAFPGKVANVMINTYRPNVFQAPSAVQAGKWDVAAEQSGKDGFAFDFSDSPMGDDIFDLFPQISLISSGNKTYKDMFTGLIYYKGPSQQYAGHGFPYLFAPDNREKLKSEVAVMPEDKLSNYDYLKFGNFIEKGGNYLENLIYNLLYFFFFSISVILLAGMSITGLVKSKRRWATKK